MNSSLPLVLARSHVSSVWRSHSWACGAFQGASTGTSSDIWSSCVTAAAMSPATTGSGGRDPLGPRDRCGGGADGRSADQPATRDSPGFHWSLPLASGYGGEAQTCFEARIGISQSGRDPADMPRLPSTSMGRSELGQASVEWSALLLVLALIFGGLGYAVARTEAWRFGSNLMHALVCAVGVDCDEGEDALARAYGPELASLVRRYSPNVAYEASSAELP